MKETPILLEKNIPATMRDGTVLYADIYRPNEKGNFPVLLTRIPYGKHFPYYSHRYLDTNRLVERGYVVIIQDVRGRFASEGTFSMFMNEADDGYDTIEWAASLPYASGKVGMFGLSYYGFTQLLAATQRPPHLHAIFPAQTLNDPRNGNMYQNGAFALGLFETLMLESIIPDQIKRTSQSPEDYAKMMKKWAEIVNHIEEWYRFAPIHAWPPLEELGMDADFFDMLSHSLREEAYWKQMSIMDQYADIEVPAFHAGGWYDCLLNTTVENYTNMAEKTNRSQKLIIGPWAHGNFGSVIGERSFGVQASEDWIDQYEDLTELHLRWFDYWLKGQDTGMKDEAPIKIFVMGINTWRGEQEWPLQRTIYTPFYFHGLGKANTRYGDGKLSTSKPAQETADQFNYDPQDPVPTHGGGTLYDSIDTDGPRDQRPIEDREDVLVYTSEPLKEPLEITGPIKVKLWARTDAKDTDFTAKLMDVQLDGTAYNLTDGIVRARFRKGYSPEPDLNGEVVAYDIDLWVTSNVFLPGHQIRVDITSSNFPRFDTNPNTGETLMDTSEIEVAQQTVYHDKEYASHILLPVIPDPERS